MPWQLRDEQSQLPARVHEHDAWISTTQLNHFEGNTPPSARLLSEHNVLSSLLTSCKTYPVNCRFIAILTESDHHALLYDIMTLPEASKIASPQNLVIFEKFRQIASKATQHSRIRLRFLKTQMNYIHNYIGTKICEKCLNHAITSYIFIHQFNFTRERLELCVSLMLDNLSKINPYTNVFVQVSPPSIMAPPEDTDETLLLDETDFMDESKIKIEVLEDEFRLKSDSETEVEPEPEDIFVPSPPPPTKRIKADLISTPEIKNLARNATKTYMNKKLVNGLQQNSKYPVDVCSEFLTFNKRKTVEKVSFKFTCPLCNKHFISEYFLKRHILKHVNKKVQCNICHGVFKSKFHLYEHTKMAHLLKESFFMSCKVCGRNFTDTDKLQTHEENHRIKPCQLCNKIYVTQTHYENHIQRHAVKLKLLKEKQVQTCSFCEKECLNDNELSVHVNKIHLQIKPYSCDMCDRQFYTESNLRSHKRVHSMPSKETCAFCSKTFRSRKQLVIHVRKHIGAKPFCCQICGQAFYSAFKAREHLRIYHGGRYCCRICKYIFATKYELKEHISKDHNAI